MTEEQTPEKKGMLPKEFIQKVLINNIGEIVRLEFYYLSFVPMAVGIEFLGKALNGLDEWNVSGRSKTDFELAINELDSFERYRTLLTTHKLWDSLRNGFLHSFVAKPTLSLSSGDEDAHLLNITATKINLRCEDLYIDFRGACEEIIAREFPIGKMTRPLLYVPPETSFSASTEDNRTE